jgi:SAM-dependent methyltransferase
MYERRYPAARANIMLSIAQALADREHSSCLEPGCGAGYLTLRLAEMFSEVDAYDSCPEMIEAAVPLENVAFFVADADAWQPERRYTVTFLSEILEHVHDPTGLVRRCADVSDYLVASAPLDEPLAGDRAFNVEAHAQPQTLQDGAGHLWSWDWQGFAVMFARYKWLCQARFARYGIAAVVTGSGEECDT